MRCAGDFFSINDHIRAHGQDSETLNVIYVVDEAGLLIDDIRMREFLVVPLTRHVSDLMDRRFVALKASFIEIRMGRDCCGAFSRQGTRRLGWGPLGNLSR